MTHTQYAHVLQSELQKLNEKIDLKILYGQSYSSDAKRHKMLQEQARKLRRKKQVGFFTKLISPFYTA